MEHQIKLNRSSKIQIKPNFFEAFNFSNYTKPQQQQKLTMKERLISKIMQSKSIDQETQKKITNLYRTKKTVDMKQEQQDSISDAIIKRQEWEQQQKELTKQQSLFNNNKIKEQELQKNNNHHDEKQKEKEKEKEKKKKKKKKKKDDGAFFLMTKIIDVKDVDN